MKKALLYVLLAVSILSVLLSRIGSADSFGEGETLYENKCQICHGPRGNGEGPAAAAYSPRPADFTTPKFWQQKDVDQLIAQTIRKGHGAMPALDLDAEEIRATIDYLSRAFKPKM